MEKKEQEQEQEQEQRQEQKQEQEVKKGKFTDYTFIPICQQHKHNKVFNVVTGICFIVMGITSIFI